MDFYYANMTEKKRIAVIGAGIVGICQALYLQRAGYQVCLIDRKGIAEECSKGNAGHFATEQVFPLADPSLLSELPKILLDPAGPFRVQPNYFLQAMPWLLRFLLNMKPRRVRANTDAIKALNQRAIAAYQPLIEDSGLSSLLSLNGSLLVFEQPINEKSVRLYQSFLAELVGVELLDRDQTLALEPNLSSAVQSSLFFTEVGHSVNPERLCKALADHFLVKGGEYLQAEVKGLDDLGHGVRLTTDKQSDGEGVQPELFDRVVIATGAWSKSLLKPLGYSAPLDTERGYHLMVPIDNLLQRPVASAERKFIITPMESGLRLAGTVEFAGLKAKPNYRRAEMLLPQAQALLQPQLLSPQQSVKDLDRWMGFRPSLPDSLPVMGRAKNHPGIFFNFGHQHLGLTWAAICAEQMSQYISSETTDIDLSAYSIDRF